MKSYNTHLFFCLLLLSFLQLFAVSITHSSDIPDQVNLSLKMAMAMAISNNLDLRVDALDSSMAETDIHRSRGIYDPFFSTSASTGETFYIGETYGTSEVSTSASLTQYLPTGGSVSATTFVEYTQPDDGSPSEDWTDWYSSVGLTLVQPLLKNAGKEATELNISLAGINHEDSIEQFRDSVIDTVYSVIRAYHRLYALRQVLESREKALASARQLRDEIVQQGKPGMKQSVELANTEYAINDRLKDLVTAERNIKDEEADLRYLIGDESKITLIPVDPPSREEPLETTEQAIALALEKRSDLKQLRLELQSSELEERVKKKNLWPTLAFTASAGLRGVEDTFSESFDQITDGQGSWWSAGVQFSVPLGNSVAEADYNRNRLRTQQVKSRIAAEKWQLRDDIEADMRALLSARVQRQVADKAVTLAAQRVETYQKSLAGKTSNVQDLLNAENDLVSALNDQTAALEYFANGVALLWKDSGVLLERKKINIDTSQPEKLTAGTQELVIPGPNALQWGENGILVPSTLQTLKTVPPLSSAIGTDTQSSDTTAEKNQVGQVKTTSDEKTVGIKQSLSPEQKLTGKSESASGYTLKIGEYASSELALIKEKVKLTGLVPQVKSGPKQPRQVVRLFVGSYQSKKTAQDTKRKLDATKAGSFILGQGKKGYRLYAGSFFSLGGAQREQQRLAALGTTVTLEESTVQLPTTLLTAGKFSSREAALAESSKLETLGVDSVVQSIAGKVQGRDNK